MLGCNGGADEYHYPPRCLISRLCDHHMPTRARTTSHALMPRPAAADPASPADPPSKTARERLRSSSRALTCRHGRHAPAVPGGAELGHHLTACASRHHACPCASGRGIDSQATAMASIRFAAGRYGGERSRPARRRSCQTIAFSTFRSRGDRAAAADRGATRTGDTSHARRSPPCGSRQQVCSRSSKAWGSFLILQIRIGPTCSTTLGSSGAAATPVLRHPLVVSLDAAW